VVGGTRYGFPYLKWNYCICYSALQNYKHKEKMMQKLKPVLILLLTILFVLAGSFPLASVVLAATCSGTGCNGSFASSTGCGDSVTNVKTIYPASSRVDLRYSTNCYTLWAKTTNTDGLGRSFYANATLWFQSSPYYYSVSSGGKIAVNKAVVSQQRYSGIANPPGWLACGHISANPISAPVGSPCTP